MRFFASFAFFLPPCPSLIRIAAERASKGGEKERERNREIEKGEGEGESNAKFAPINVDRARDNIYRALG